MTQETPETNLAAVYTACMGTYELQSSQFRQQAQNLQLLESGLSDQFYGLLTLRSSLLQQSLDQRDLGVCSFNVHNEDANKDAEESVGLFPNARLRLLYSATTERQYKTRHFYMLCEEHFPEEPRGVYRDTNRGLGVECEIKKTEDGRFLGLLAPVRSHTLKGVSQGEMSMCGVVLKGEVTQGRAKIIQFEPLDFTNSIRMNIENQRREEIYDFFGLSAQPKRPSRMRVLNF